jgi:hypothetical protein
MTASGACFEKIKSPNKFESDVNIIDPTIAKIHFKVHARNVAIRRGSLKWSLDGLPSSLGSPGWLRTSSGTHVNWDIDELNASMPNVKPTFGVHKSNSKNFYTSKSLSVRRCPYSFMWRNGFK